MWTVIYDKPEMVNIFPGFDADVDLRRIENKSAADYANELPQNSKIRKDSAFKRFQSTAARKKNKIYRM